MKKLARFIYALIIGLSIGVVSIGPAWSAIDQIAGQDVSGLDQISGQSISGLDQVAEQDLPSVGGVSYGVGDILSERFGTTGSDGSDNIWTESTQGDGVYNDDDQTYAGSTGFEGDHLTVSGSSNFEANALIDLGSSYTTGYFRFYYRFNSESWGDGVNESLFAANVDGATWSNNLVSISVQQVATNQLQLRCVFNAGSSFTTGTNVYNITTGQVYKVEVKFVDNGASDQIEWWVNDVSIGSRSDNFANWDGTGFRDIQIGITYNSAASNHSIDTFDISSTGRLTDE